MMGGNQPVKAVTYICDLVLFWVVFGLPPNVDPLIPEACDRFVAPLLASTLSKLLFLKC